MLTIKDRPNLHQLNSCFLLQDTDNWGYGWGTTPTRPSKYRYLLKLHSSMTSIVKLIIVPIIFQHAISTYYEDKSIPSIGL